jgi:uncharacterized protein (DUF427 family)
MKLPGTDHPITIAPFEGRVRVTSGDRVIADSRRALALEEASYPVAYYLPAEDVRVAELQPSPTRTHCPYKGEASYLSLPGGPADIAWSYQQPFPAVAEIAGHWAFYSSKVSVEATPG